MRRFHLALMFCAVFLSVVSTPAHAEFSWDWLDYLSGPGRFRGPAVDVRLVGFLEKPEAKTLVVGGIISACSFAPGERRRSSIDLNFGFMRAAGNPQFADGKEIKLRTLEPSFSWHVWGPLEMGTGASVYWFSSEGFPSFSRVALEPIRFDLRPGRLDDLWHPRTAFKNTNNNWWQEVLVLKLGWVVIPSGFEPNDFHATADKARRIPSEFVKTWGVFIDAEPIIRKIRGQWD